MNPSKPGYQTTEFWLAVASQLLMLLVMIGIIPATDQDMLFGAVSACIVAAFALVTNGWIIVSYIRGRVAAKTEAMKLDEQTKPADTPADTLELTIQE